jgi:putative endonuclease
MHIHPIFYVCILKCADDSFYIGMTNHLDKRINEHESSKYPGSYTYNRRPIELMFYETFTDPESAYFFEQKIKKWSRAKKQALIEENYHKLPSLSKKNFVKSGK